ncbi:MAG: AEC family transporter [Candidatus Krumholzibacteriota bacterium]|nr:AEC family transporter [Candidatus Krumholzibacteriota bacterium]
MPVITEVILPILFVVFLGYLLRRLGKLDEHAFSRAQLYVLGPALVFMTMAGSEAAMPLVMKVFLHVTILSILLFISAWLLGIFLKSDRLEKNAIAITSIFTNSGFYGIPVCMLAFGDEGVIYASIYVVCSATIQSTAGVYIASAGSRSPMRALATVFKVPLIHAIVVAKLLAHFDLLPSEPFMKMITLLGRSAIPLGLLLLGMQLEKIISEKKGSAEVSVSIEGRRDLVGGVSSGLLKIAGGFLFALLILQFLDFEPVLRNVIIVQSSMPTAVNAVVYATEFECRPKLVTIGILTATMISVASISLILSWLN